MTKLPATWRKSSFSAEQAECVEVAGKLDMIRDSKNPTVELTVDVRSLVRGLRGEEHPS